MKEDAPQSIQLTNDDFTRLANNFYVQNSLEYSYERIVTDSNLFNYIALNKELINKKQKVAFVFICLNPLYWQYAPEMVKGAKTFFLPGHKTDYLFWTDIPKEGDLMQRILADWSGALANKGIDVNHPTNNANLLSQVNGVVTNLEWLRTQDDIKIFPTEVTAWPFPTLMRYHLFLQQEELLKEYDYIFYCDVDMAFVNVVGDELLGEDLTACPHPGYAIRKEYYPPYEPNSDSACYIPRPGRVVVEGGKARFRPEYYAGGLQGGKSDKFIEAMKSMRGMVDQDLGKNYIPIWNDESAWNKYLSQNPPSVMLDPGYIYPDSLINEYYIPLWGRKYVPKLKCLTKWFSTSAAGGEHVQKLLAEPKLLK